jgi:hypothetical protein
MNDLWSSMWVQLWLGVVRSFVNSIGIALESYVLG